MPKRDTRDPRLVTMIAQEERSLQLEKNRKNKKLKNKERDALRSVKGTREKLVREIGEGKKLSRPKQDKGLSNHDGVAVQVSTQYPGRSEERSPDRSRVKVSILISYFPHALQSTTGH
jgi:hypothetical protein